MHRVYAASASIFAATPSPDFAAVRLFCLLGLALSLAVIPHIDANAMASICAHIE
jgi:hypothetical protein